MASMKYVPDSKTKPLDWKRRGPASVLDGIVSQSQNRPSLLLGTLRCWGGRGELEGV